MVVQWLEQPKLVLSPELVANILNISRQYLVELLEAQAIVGTHRRTRFGDLMNYKNDCDAK